MAPKTLPPSAANHAVGSGGDLPLPGVVVVFSGGSAASRAMTVGAEPLELGRDDAGTGTSGKLDDGRVSRRHALVAFQDGRCLITDLRSQNGTFVDGERISPEIPVRVHCLIRVGDTLLVPCADVRPFERGGVQCIDGFVRGPAMLALLEDAARAAQTGTTLHVRGESGSGKEGIAQAFHRAGSRAGKPLIAVNCAAIPHGIAERLLFGNKRGAYSGAETDAPGYVQEAEGGTLFLDEVAELDAQVQAKLLRVLESHEVLPLGAAKPRKVDFALCSATNKDLRALVAAGALREDLYFRLGYPAVVLPPLRKRPEEIPALVVQELARMPASPAAHVSLIEQCLLRPWPGNVRELLAEIRNAAHLALSEGNRVESRHLAATAGTVFGSAMSEIHAASDAAAADWPRRRTPRIDPESRKRIEDALRASGGNVAAAARALELHRTQLRRLLARHRITVPGDDHGDADHDDDRDEADEDDEDDDDGSSA